MEVGIPVYNGNIWYIFQFFDDFLKRASDRGMWCNDAVIPHDRDLERLGRISGAIIPWYGDESRFRKPWFGVKDGFHKYLDSF